MKKRTKLTSASDYISRSIHIIPVCQPPVIQSREPRTSKTHWLLDLPPVLLNPSAYDLLVFTMKKLAHRWWNRCWSASLQQGSIDHLEQLDFAHFVCMSRWREQNLYPFAWVVDGLSARSQGKGQNQGQGSVAARKVAWTSRPYWTINSWWMGGFENGLR